jgi:hypothetical protein
MKNAPEQWRPIAGYEGFYEVSDQGRVRSVDRVVIRSTGVAQKNRGRVLRPYLNELRGGYLGVHLCRNSITRTFAVHLLVAAAFVPNPENLPEVDHRDRVRVNNAALNLRWASRSTQGFNTEQTPGGTNPHRGVWNDGPRYRRPWVAALGRKRLGRFFTAEEARKVRAEAFSKLQIQ